MNKRICVSIVLSIIGYINFTYSQGDSTIFRNDKICYALIANSKQFGIYKNEQVFVDSIQKFNVEFLFSCDMTKLFEVKSQNSWKTYYILTTDESDASTYTYSCLGTDSKKYVFILDLESSTLTKMHEDTLTYVEMNTIESLRVIQN